MSSLSSVRPLAFRVLIVALSLSAALVLAGAQTPQVEAKSSPSLPAGLAPNAPSGALWCTVATIQVTENRIAVRCNPGVGPIIWFAYDTTTTADAGIANRYLALVNTGFALSSHVGFWYADDPALNPAGCAIDNCRRITQVLVEP